MRSVVHAAWDEGCRTKEGFWLGVMLREGTLLAGSCYEPGPTMLVMNCYQQQRPGGVLQTTSMPRKLYINLADVTAAWVED